MWGEFLVFRSRWGNFDFGHCLENLVFCMVQRENLEIKINEEYYRGKKRKNVEGIKEKN